MWSSGPKQVSHLSGGGATAARSDRAELAARMLQRTQMPVTFDASSDASHSTVLATSSGWLRRRRSRSLHVGLDAARLLLEVGQQRRGLGGTGRDRVGPDAVRPVLGGHRLHQVDHAGLGRRRSRRVRTGRRCRRPTTCSRSSPRRPHHVGQHRPGREEHRVEGEALLEAPVVVADGRRSGRCGTRRRCWRARRCGRGARRRPPPSRRRRRSPTRRPAPPRPSHRPRAARRRPRPTRRPSMSLSHSTAPSAANRRAMARPMPFAAALTSATFPSMPSGHGPPSESVVSCGVVSAPIPSGSVRHGPGDVVSHGGPVRCGSARRGGDGGPSSGRRGRQGRASRSRPGGRRPPHRRAPPGSWEWRRRRSSRTPGR